MVFNSRKTRSYGTKGQCYTCGADKINGVCSDKNCRSNKKNKK